MKIVCKDNFDRDWISDKLIASDVSPYYADIIVRFLNEREGEHTDNYYVVKPDDYKLYVWEP